jgi:hypothetical protein
MAITKNETCAYKMLPPPRRSDHGRLTDNCGACRSSAGRDLLVLTSTNGSTNQVAVSI